MANKVGPLIKEARTGAGMTQEQLAKKIKGGHQRGRARRTGAHAGGPQRDRKVYGRYAELAHQCGEGIYV